MKKQAVVSGQWSVVSSWLRGWGAVKQPTTVTRQRTQRGFTLLELIITLAIMAILVGMAVPLARNNIKRTREEELHRSLRELRMAIDAFHRDCGMNMFTELESDRFKDCYPKKLDYLVEGMRIRGTVDKTQRYLRRIPRDPMTHS